MNIDDLFAEIEADERADRLEQQTKATPIDYAKLRGIRPQMVYYHLRRGNLEWTACECGRRVIMIEEADKIFKAKKENDDG
jgi:hypothetical protein